MDNYENIPLVSQPFLNKTLFNHQLASIYKMEKLEREKLVSYDKGIKETRVGINADHTGYGKTLSMIGLIYRDKMEWDMDIPFINEKISSEASGLIKNREINRHDKLNCSLIIVSPSIISQWEEEFLDIDLKVNTVSTRREVDSVVVEDCDVVIVSTTMFNYLEMSYSKYAWKRFIFDEPGHVKVTGMKEIVAGFYWFVSATPEAMITRHQNCRGSFMKKIIGDGWCKIEEQFYGMIIKNDLNFIKNSFELPPVHHSYHNCFQPVLNVVSGIVNNEIHNMIAAGNIEGVILSLGGKKTKNIIELVRQEKLEKQAKIKAKIDIYSNIKKDEKKLKDSIEEDRRISNQLATLNTRFEYMVGDFCPICSEKFIKPVLETKCHNLFCGKCLLTWLETKQNCPICRAHVDPKDLIYLSKEKDNLDNQSKEQINKKITPLEKVLEILKSSKGKFIIFSSYNESFHPLCRLFDENNISFSLLKGSGKMRKISIDKFKNGDTQVLFLNSTLNCAGINLQEATDIIMYHKMSKTTEKQIIGRANRIGRTKPLRVHHLKVNI